MDVRYALIVVCMEAGSVSIQIRSMMFIEERV